jgi:hypothetical protein
MSVAIRRVAGRPMASLALNRVPYMGRTRQGSTGARRTSVQPSYQSAGSTDTFRPVASSRRVLAAEQSALVGAFAGWHVGYLNRCTGRRRSVSRWHNCYSITSSAIASTPSGMVRPSDLATLRLISSSNLADCTTGSSVGCAPRKILPL